jgi:peptidoglycan hydrolase-like protein with peptidoglycan-binding domain
MSPSERMFGTATQQALIGLQTARGLPASGETDPATWQAVLALPVQPADWMSRGSGPQAATAAGGRAPAAARLPARREEMPPPGERR